MAQANFRDLLGARASQIEKPKPLPVGTYQATVDKWEPTESSEKKTPGIKVTFQMRAPMDDVDLTQLEEIGGLPTVQKRKVSTTYWITDDSTYRLKEFLEGPCKIEGGDRSLAEMLAEVKGVGVRVVISHRMGNKGDVMTDIDEVLVDEG